MVKTRKPLGSLASQINVDGEESVRRRVGPEQSPVQRHTARMYERREEAWRPLNRHRVAAFLRLFLLCFVETENGRPLQPVTYRMMKKTLCKRIIPWIDRLLVCTMNEWMWPISMNDFKELDQYLGAHLRHIHVDQHWENIAHFFKGVEKKKREEEKSPKEEEEDPGERNYQQYRQTDEYYRDIVDFC